MTMERTDTASPTATTLRTVLLVLAGAALIGGSFLSWISFGALGDLAEAAGQEIPSTAGVNAPFSIFYSFGGDEAGNFFTSAGMATIVIGVLALIGIALPVLARVAGAFGLVAFILFVITLYRAQGGFGDIGLGMWVVLGGAVLVLIGGFVGTRRVVA